MDDIIVTFLLNGRRKDFEKNSSTKILLWYSILGDIHPLSFDQLANRK